MEKECCYFLYTIYKAGRKPESFSHSLLVVFPLLVMQQISSFFKQVCFFFKNASALLVSFNRMPYMQMLDKIPGVNIIGAKLSVASINRAGGLGVFWDPNGGFRGQSTLRKFVGSKEHLDWLKINLNVTEMLIVHFEILGWCPVGPVLPHGEKVPL